MAETKTSGLSVGHDSAAVAEEMAAAFQVLCGAAKSDKGRLQRLESEVAQLQQKVMATKHELTNKNSTIKTLCDAAKADKARIEMLDSEVTSQAQRLQAAEQAREEAAAAMKSMRAACKADKAQLQKQAGELAKLKEALQEAGQEKEAVEKTLQAHHEATDVDKAQIESLQAELAAMQARADNFEREKANGDEKLRELEVLMEQRLAEAADESTKQVKQWKSEVNRVQRKLNQRSFDNLVQQHEIKRLQQQLQEQQEKAVVAAAETDAVRQKYQKMAQQLKAMLAQAANSLGGAAPTDPERQAADKESVQQNWQITPAAAAAAAVVRFRGSMNVSVMGGMSGGQKEVQDMFAALAVAAIRQPDGDGRQAAAAAAAAAAAGRDSMLGSVSGGQKEVQDVIAALAVGEGRHTVAATRQPGGSGRRSASSSAAAAAATAAATAAAAAAVRDSVIGSVSGGQKEVQDMFAALAVGEGRQAVAATRQPDGSGRRSAFASAATAAAADFRPRPLSSRNGSQASKSSAGDLAALAANRSVLSATAAAAGTDAAAGSNTAADHDLRVVPCQKQQQQQQQQRPSSVGGSCSRAGTSSKFRARNWFSFSSRSTTTATTYEAVSGQLSNSNQQQNQVSGTKPGVLASLGLAICGAASHTGVIRWLPAISKHSSRAAAVQPISVPGVSMQFHGALIRGAASHTGVMRRPSSSNSSRAAAAAAASAAAGLGDGLDLKRQARAATISGTVTGHRELRHSSSSSAVKSTCLFSNSTSGVSMYPSRALMRQVQSPKPPTAAHKVQSREPTAVASSMQSLAPAAAAHIMQSLKPPNAADRFTPWQPVTAAHKTAIALRAKSLDTAPTATAHQSAFDAAMMRMKVDSNAWDVHDAASDECDTSDWRLRSFPLLTNQYSSSSSSSSSLIGAGDSTTSICSSDGRLTWQTSNRAAGTQHAEVKCSGVTSHPVRDISSSSTGGWKQECAADNS